MNASPHSRCGTTRTGTRLCGGELDALCRRGFDCRPVRGVGLAPISTIGRTTRYCRPDLAVVIGFTAGTLFSLTTGETSHAGAASRPGPTHSRRGAAGGPGRRAPRSGPVLLEYVGCVPLVATQPAGVNRARPGRRTRASAVGVMRSEQTPLPRPLCGARSRRLGRRAVKALCEYVEQGRAELSRSI
jgi:hypothetical protein